jgi:hypothetical protein
MRKLVILFLALSACDPGIKPDAELLSEWQWVSSGGGFAGQVLTPASTGEEITVEFTAKKFFKYVNGQLTEEFRYTIKLEESIFSTEPQEIINYSNGWRQSYLIKDDTLYLSDQCYDCFGHVYVKRKGD